MPKDFWAFRQFLKAARGRSQEEIIIEFLASTVLNDSVSENGSVLTIIRQSVVPFRVANVRLSTDIGYILSEIGA